MPLDRDDSEIRAVIAASRAQSYSDMTSEVAATVGPDRAGSGLV